MDADLDVSGRRRMGGSGAILLTPEQALDLHLRTSNHESIAGLEGPLLGEPTEDSESEIPQGVANRSGRWLAHEHRRA